MDDYIGKKDELEIEVALMHYGVKRRSGRYPWGSGEDPYQHGMDFLGRYDEMREKFPNMSEVELAKALGCSSTTELRKQKQLAKDERRRDLVKTAESLVYDDGLSISEAARRMGFNSDSSVRSLLNERSKANMNKSSETADFLREQVNEKKFIDVGTGVERELGNISRTKFDAALKQLEDEGYTHVTISLPQVTNSGKMTHLNILADKGMTYTDVYEARDNAEIRSITEYATNDGGATYWKAEYPASIDSSRVYIKYGDQGGTERDGTVELRRGVPDISIGNLNACQVRIAVDNARYMKGMAFYSDEIPDGYDIVYNTNKPTGTPSEKVFKPFKRDKDGNIDTENPFGANIKINGQSTYIDKDGKEKLSVINRLKDEGDWQDQQKLLSAQFLGKQSKDLITKQLNLSYAQKEAEYSEIMSLTNPTLKRYYLQKFAEECDTSAANLKAATLPGTQWHAIAPVNTLKDTEIYAPNYKDGTQVALVRYPHAGTFEIPVLTVNNKNAEGKKFFGNAKDVVGINHNNAELLSGADFDGDTVMVIPTNNGKTKITGVNSGAHVLQDMKGYDHMSLYGTKETSPGVFISNATGKKVKIMSEEQKQREMGVVSNLITDMTLKGANEHELARAVKHSMVVIDAVKHELDWKQSELDNDIRGLKSLYQRHLDDEDDYGGASTLLSKSNAQVRIQRRTGSPRINLAENEGKTDKKGNPLYDPTRPEGALLYKTDHSSKTEWTDYKTGEIKFKTDTVRGMSLVDDANKISSGTVKEKLYANYCNKLKALANKSRKEFATTTGIKYNREAAKEYKTEVDQLNAALNVALLNAPRERQAQLIANKNISAKLASGNVSKDKKKQMKQRELEKARASVNAGSKNRKIEITDKQWEAIQKGAISNETLNKILNNTKPDSLRARAMPKTANKMSDSKIALAKTMENSGYTTEQIADRLGVSSSTVSKALRGVKEYAE